MSAPGFSWGDDRGDGASSREAALRPLRVVERPFAEEDLRQIWQQPTRVAAAAFLDRWCERADATGIRRMQQFAKTLWADREGLLDRYLYPISTGPLEGTNTKIRVLQRQAYGSRDPTFFQLKLYALHETKHALVG